MNIKKAAAAIAALLLTGVQTYTINAVSDNSMLVNSSVSGKMGDIDGDGEITSNDALYILQSVTGISDLNDEQKKIADIDSDGAITSADALYILQAVVGLREMPDAGKLPSDGDKLTIVSWNTEFADMVKNYYCKDRGWTDDGNGNFTKDGVTLNVVSFSKSSAESLDNYYRYFISGNDIDIYCMSNEWICRFLNDNYSVPLSDMGISESEFVNQYQYTKDIGTDETGVLRAVAPQCSVGGFAYRTDLAQEYLGVESPEQMQKKVKDWNTFLETAEEVYNASGDRKTALTTTFSGMWQAFSATRPTPWVMDNKVVIDDTITNFADMAHTMYEKGYVCPDIRQWTTDWYSQGQTDNTMGYFISSWGIKIILEKAAGGENGATYGKWGLVRGPQDYYSGSTWLAVAPKCDNADIAADIIRYFTADSESMKKFADNPEYIVNNKEVMQDIVASGTNINENLGGQNPYAVFMEAAENIHIAGNPTEYDTDIKSALQSALYNYNNGNYSSTDEAIEAFKSNAERIIE